MTAERIRALLSSLVTDADDPRDPCPACGDPADGRPVIMCALGPVHVEHPERTVLRYALELVPVTAMTSWVQLDGTDVALLMRWRSRGRDMSTVMIPHNDDEPPLSDATDADWLDTAMTLWGLTA